MTIEEMVKILAKKHGFEILPGAALWIAGSGNHGTLIIAIKEVGGSSVIARTILIGKREIVGFRVYYDHNWQPFAAVTDNENVVKDLEAANKKMCNLIQYIYMKSEKAWIRYGQYAPKQE